MLIVVVGIIVIEKLIREERRYQAQPQTHLIQQLLYQIQQEYITIIVKSPSLARVVVP